MMYPDIYPLSGVGSMVGITEIEQEVFRDLRTLVPRDTEIRRDQRLIADLRLLSDDATALALDMEAKFKVKIPRDAWGTVLTVQDVINLLARHISS
jgi:acyl carrier protein